MFTAHFIDHKTTLDYSKKLFLKTRGKYKRKRKTLITQG
jgi:hypothetical protein